MLVLCTEARNLAAAIPVDSSPSFSACGFYFFALCMNDKAYRKYSKNALLRAAATIADNT